MTQISPSKLQQLRARTILCCETADPSSVARAASEDALLVPHLILDAAESPAGADIVAETMAWAASHHAVASRIADRLILAFGIEMARIVPRRVTAALPADLAFDSTGSVAKAQALIADFERLGVPRERVLIGIEATWEGIEATRALQIESIDCHLLGVAGLAQAAAGAEAKAFLVSISLHAPAQSIGAKDRGLAALRSIASYYREHGIETALGAMGLGSLAEIEALADLDRLSLDPAWFERLDADRAILASPSTAPEAAPPARMRLDEKTFRFVLNEDPAASEALGTRVRRSVADWRALRAFTSRRFEANLDPFAAPLSDVLG